jgi:hypothetical protein
MGRPRHRREDHPVGRKHEAMLMRKIGIEALDQKPKTSHDHAHQVLPCWRRPNFDHPCRLNIDQGRKAARCTVGC